MAVSIDGTSQAFWQTAPGSKYTKFIEDVVEDSIAGGWSVISKTSLKLTSNIMCKVHGYVSPDEQDGVLPSRVQCKS